QADVRAHHVVRDLSAILQSRNGECGTRNGKPTVFGSAFRVPRSELEGSAFGRSSQSMAGPAESLPARCRDGARHGAGDQRAAFRAGWRAEREAGPAGRLLVVPEFPGARLAE